MTNLQSPLRDFKVEVEGQVLKARFSTGISEEVESVLYPHWHTWLPEQAQAKVGYSILAVSVIWGTLQVLVGTGSVDDDGSGTIKTIVAVLRWRGPLLAIALILGMTSRKLKIGSWFALGMYFACVGFIVYSPRLAIPILTGVMGFKAIDVCFCIVTDHGVIQWHEKLTIVHYLSGIPVFMGLFNALQFKFWCAGQYPMLCYILVFPVFQFLDTIAKSSKGDLTQFDYVVTKRVYFRLAFFRLGVLAAPNLMCLWLQSKLFDCCIKEDAWNCTPMAW